MDCHNRCLLYTSPANTTYGENTGVLELSKVHDPKVIRIAAVYAIILSFIPKMAEVIGSMPSAIIGGVSFMLYGMISAIGVRNVVENLSLIHIYRNAINIGLPILECEEAANDIDAGDTVSVDFNTGVITNETKGKTYQAEPFPAFMQRIMAAGGLVTYTKEKIEG